MPLYAFYACGNAAMRPHRVWLDQLKLFLYNYNALTIVYSTIIRFKEPYHFGPMGALLQTWINFIVDMEK